MSDGAQQSEHGPTISPLQLPIERRAWLKSAAVLAGGVAGSSVLPAGCAGIPGGAAGATPGGGTQVATPDNAVVETTAGRVRGYTRDGVYTFKGIPYGETTTGANRFMPPVKPVAWTGVRPALAWGPVSPPFPRAAWRNNEEQFLYNWDDGYPGEEMLNLNVWTPAVNDASKRPVLFWIHGGGFTYGSSHELPMLEGQNLAQRHDVVYVSINHRLNVFGYLDLSQIGGERYTSSANVGMLDVVLALEWVRDNIARFGGDPGNVTIFGQSGGGSKVSTLLAMPTAEGLFHKAMVLSGPGLRQGEPELSNRLALLLLEELQVGRTQLDRLHDLPWEQLLTAGRTAQQKLASTLPPSPPGSARRVGWNPVVDGLVLPHHPFDPTAPAISAGIPLMIGCTFHEFDHGINKPEAHLLTAEQLRANLAERFGTRVDDVIAAAQRAAPGAKPLELAGLIATTARTRGNTVTLAERKAAQHAAAVYLYWFGWKTMVLDGRPLAFHCQDLPFWFDHVDRCAQQTGGTPEAHALAEKMSGALTAFARTGDPNHAGLPRWPAFTAATGEAMVFDDVVELKNDPDRDLRRAVLST
jgi:para-nitrobenzyl esterase